MIETIDPRSDKTTGYHLFLMPEGVLAEELQQTIQNLSQVYGGPVFAPHVTLLARIPGISDDEMIEKTKDLAQALSPMNLTLGELASEPSYFRALYSRIVEHDQVREAYDKAADAFSMERNPEYLAHLSLLYGNFSEDEASHIKASVTLPADVQFVADKLHLFRTKGAVGQWQKVAEFPCTGGH